MTQDLAALLSMPITEAKRPPQLPVGDYHCVITQYEFDKSSQKQTDFVKYHLQPQAPVDSTLDLAGVNLSDRQLSIDFYLTPAALYMLREALENCGVVVEGRGFAEAIPDMMGKQVVASVEHQLNRKDPTAPPYVRVKRIAGTK